MKYTISNKVKNKLRREIVKGFKEGPNIEDMLSRMTNFIEIVINDETNKKTQREVTLQALITDILREGGLQKWKNSF